MFKSIFTRSPSLASVLQQLFKLEEVFAFGVASKLTTCQLEHDLRVMYTLLKLHI